MRTTVTAPADLPPLVAGTGTGRFLAFDTSTERMSVAVSDGARLWEHEGPGGAQSSSTLIPASHAYFLNTDYLELVVHRDANMEMMDDLRSINQDAIVKSIIWQGNVAVSNRSLQGVMKA